MLESAPGCRSTSLPGVTLRTFRPDELEFLLRLYATTREDELRRVDWSDAEKRAFVRSQFELQHTHYQTHYAGADFDVILERGEPIGRIYVYCSPSEIRLMEITLLPERRNRGIGGALTAALCEEAARSGRRVVLHVEPWNPAHRLYARLGFEDAGEEGAYRRMEWSPPRS